MSYPRNLFWGTVVIMNLEFKINFAMVNEINKIFRVFWYITFGVVAAYSSLESRIFYSE